MSNYATGPNTFEQLRRSARAFRPASDDADGLPALAPAFREGVVQGEPDIAALVEYANRRGCRISGGDGEDIGAAVRAVLPGIAPLAASALEFDDLRCATLDIIAQAFDGLAQVDGVGATTASVILTALNPQLFVAWGPATRDAYFPGGEADGEAYAQFLTVMRMAAIAIAGDARAQHGIDDPAGHLSAELGINPPFSLARFIDEYNRLTIERGVTRRTDYVAVPA